MERALWVPLWLYGRFPVRTFLAMGPRGLWRVYRACYDSERSAQDREKDAERCSLWMSMEETAR
jgi:hypothetical protein